jgi:hypothetical protein
MDEKQHTELLEAVLKLLTVIQSGFKTMADVMETDAFIETAALAASDPRIKDPALFRLLS